LKIQLGLLHFSSLPQFCRTLAFLTKENAVELHSLGRVCSNTRDDDRGKI